MNRHLPTFFWNWTLGVWILFAPMMSQAQETNNTVKVSGFGSLGVSYNPKRDFDFVRDLLQADGVGYSGKIDFGLDSRLGLQISNRVNQQLEFTGQVVSRRGLHQFRPEITWAYAKYMPSDELDIRLGRLGFDVYPLADSRNVAFSYLWVRPPVDYFGNLIVNYIDGVDVVYHYPIANFTGKLKLFAGESNEEAMTSSHNIVFSLKGSRILGGHLEFQSQRWLARVGYTELQFANEFPNFDQLLAQLRSPSVAMLAPNTVQLAHQLQFKDKKMRYFASGLIYDNGPFQAQWMLSKIRSETLGFATTNSGFLTLAYRIGKWTPYVSSSKTYPSQFKPVQTGLPTHIAPAFAELDGTIKHVVNATKSEQKTISLGIRYALNPNSDLKCQIDQLKNTAPLLIRHPQASWNGKGNIYTCTYNFVF